MERWCTRLEISWKKKIICLLLAAILLLVPAFAGLAPVTAFAAKEQEGPGHNSFFRDEDGILYVAYHAQRPGEDNRRNTAIRQVFLGYEGFPMLDCV